MKRLLSFGLLLLVIVSCEQCPDRSFTSASDEIEDVSKLINDYENADWDSWLGHYASDAKIFHNSFEQMARPKQMLDVHKEILSSFSSYGFEDSPRSQEMVIGDDGLTWVYFWGNWKGTLTATGEVITLPVHLALNYVKGKIAQEFGFYDMSKYILAIQSIEAAAEEMEATTE